MTSRAARACCVNPAPEQSEQEHGTQLTPTYFASVASIAHHRDTTTSAARWLRSQKLLAQCEREQAKGTSSNPYSACISRCVVGEQTPQPRALRAAQTARRRDEHQTFQTLEEDQSGILHQVDFWPEDPDKGANTTVKQTVELPVVANYRPEPG